MPSSNTKKLAVLRSRTDHDLLLLIQRELDRGFVLADVAASRNSPSFVKAQKCYETAEALLPRISGLSPDSRLLIDARLKKLRLRLDQVPAYASLRSYVNSFAS
ncbi:MAG TPA: hypothetical protein VMH81_12580 [Bryobacteraceae bacterium]|nr:hypothetical protein [Bryobacteraceae bacterium]